MKTLTFLSCCLLCLATLSKAQNQDDVTAIKNTIVKETTAFFGLDRKNWETHWLNAPYTYWSYSDSTGSSYVEGTPSIISNFDEYFRTAKPSKSKIDRVWIEVRVYGKGAYVRFIQKAWDDIDLDETSEVRVLEKDKNGQWKIVCLQAIAMYNK